MKILDKLDGKKSYLAGAGLMLFALLGYALGELALVDAGTKFFAGLGVIGFRHAILKASSETP